MKSERTFTALEQGIKAVGIGKKGSKSLTPDLVVDILQELKEKTAAPVAEGAFWGALFIKGITPDELALDKAFAEPTLKSAQKLAAYICTDAPQEINSVCVSLLNKETLSLDQSYRVGKFLLSGGSGDLARGLIVSILRVRYETPDEYEGLLKSFQDAMEPSFQTDVSDGDTIIQMAEPFDGVSRSYLITPLIAANLQKDQYRVVHLVGRNSGPKFGNTLAELVDGLKIDTVKENKQIDSSAPKFGWFLHQRDLSPALDRWVDMRKKTIKRPCFATLEKFLNPTKARIIITSAFHLPYAEKMTTVAERAGFPGSVVVRNGLEATIAFPLKRAVKVLCSARKADGTYKRKEFVFDPNTDFDIKVDKEEKVVDPELKENIKLIQNYVEKGSPDNALFDMRVDFTSKGLRQAIKWVEGNIE